MKMIFKKLSLSFLAILPFAIAGVACAWQIGLFPNWGLESGYYGQFNRVKHVIESMPRVTIQKEWLHEDLTLEDFGFTLTVEGSNSIDVMFWDGSFQMKTRDKSQIRQYILESINSNNASQATSCSPRLRSNVRLYFTTASDVLHPPQPPEPPAPTGHT
jgi:hypothetical protein